MRHTTMVLAAITIAAVGCGDWRGSAGDTALGAASPIAPAGKTALDPAPGDIPARGALPTGYTALTDRPAQQLASDAYAVDGSRWEVRTGPAHVLYDPTHTARGDFVLSGEFEQLEAPAHAEAFGLVFGGSGLEDHDRQRYTYFLVRGGGEYLVRVREGADTRDVIAWRAHESIPRQGPDGRATYRLSVRADGDSVRFLVNDRQVGSVARATVPVDGTYGLRINHNLRLRTTAPTLSQ